MLRSGSGGSWLARFFVVGVHFATVSAARFYSIGFTHQGQWFPPLLLLSVVRQSTFDWNGRTLTSLMSWVRVNFGVYFTTQTQKIYHPLKRSQPKKKKILRKTNLT